MSKITTRIYQKQIRGLSKGELILYHMQLANALEKNADLEDVIKIIDKFKSRHDLNITELVDATFTFITKYSTVIDIYAQRLKLQIIRNYTSQIGTLVTKR